MSLNIKEVLIDTIKEAGALILKRFDTEFEITAKEGINNLVTEVDMASERLIRANITSAFPTHHILGEEYGGEVEKSGYLWIIDPIDGTINYAQGIPLCCVSIGVMKDGEMLFGAVYNPMMKELFFAEKGQGAYLNDRPIRVSEARPFLKSCLVTGFPYKHPEQVDIVAIFAEVASLGIPIRRLGSAALDLCWVACGRFDGFWEFSLNAWDIAAGYLIVQEAGGKITGFQDEEMNVFSKETLATNGHIHEDLKSVIQKFI